MDDSAEVVPPYLAPPFRLATFPALSLSAARVGDPASARAFARPYRDVTARLRRWQRGGHVRRERRPALYLHEYTAGGLTVRGLVGALDLSRRATDISDSTVLPHEAVHVAQAHELAARMAEMQLNPAPILLVHRGGGETGRVLAERLSDDPDHEYDDRAGQRHRVWSVHGQELLTPLAEHLAGTRALLADGHHRYAASLELQERYPDSGWGHGLVMLVDQDDSPLHLGAIHRVIPGLSVGRLAELAAEAGVRLDRVHRQDAYSLLDRSHPVAAGGDWMVMDLGNGPDELAVSALHDRILSRLPASTAPIGYHHTAQDALDAAERQRGTAILMPSAEFDTVYAAARAGILLPEKATSFQPKPSPGSLMRSSREPAATARS